MVSELIGKYIWLIQILSAAGERGLTLDEIRERYSRRYGKNYSRNTFNNHLRAIEETFGIEVTCNRRTNCYFIPFGESALDGDESVSWMINTFTVGNLLTMSRERLSGRVSVEEIPSGQKFLTAVMQAMEDGMELEITYAKYSSSTPETLHIQPFAVKEHERRWYLVAYCHERAGNSKDNSRTEAWRVYGMDRIHTLKETATPFKLPKGFDVDTLFYQSYGIFFPKAGEKAVTIRFKTTDIEARYLRDLPLHRSQKEEGPSPDGDGRVFTIRVIPNKNLMMEFCRHAGSMEVLEPEDIRNALAARLKLAARAYSKS
jgi:Predicted transcriptional regulator